MWFKSESTLKQALPNLAEDKLLEAKDLLAQAPTSAWYVRGLLAFAAWFASLFFLSFLVAINIFDDEVAMISLGVFFYLPTMALSQKFKEYIFLKQANLVFHLVGLALVLGGIGLESKSFAGLCITAILLQLGSIVFYADSTMKFIAGFGVFLALNILLYDLKLEILIHFVLSIQAFLISWLFTNEEKYLQHNKASAIRSAAMGVTANLCFSMAVFALPHSGEQVSNLASHWYLTSTGILAALLFLEYQVMHSLKVDFHSGILVYVVTLVFGLLTYQAPGITASLLVLGIAMQQQSRPLFGFAAFSLLAFISQFYYSLQFDLQFKSFMLMAGGLLAGTAGYLCHRALADGEANHE